MGRILVYCVWIPILFKAKLFSQNIDIEWIKEWNSKEFLSINMGVIDNGSCFLTGHVAINKSKCSYCRKVWITEINDQGEPEWEHEFRLGDTSEGLGIFKLENGDIVLLASYKNNLNSSQGVRWSRKKTIILLLDSVGNKKWTRNLELLQQEEVIAYKQVGTTISFLSKSSRKENEFFEIEIDFAKESQKSVGIGLPEIWVKKFKFLNEREKAYLIVPKKMDKCDLRYSGGYFLGEREVFVSNSFRDPKNCRDKKKQKIYLLQEDDDSWKITDVIGRGEFNKVNSLCKISEEDLLVSFSIGKWRWKPLLQLQKTHYFGIINKDGKLRSKIEFKSDKRFSSKYIIQSDKEDGVFYTIAGIQKKGEKLVLLKASYVE